ncbi:MAG: YcxB family protein [Lysobacteraceae bacterium]
MQIRYRLDADDYFALQRALLHQLQRAAGMSQGKMFAYHVLVWIPVGVAAAALIDAVQRRAAPAGLALLVFTCAAAILLVRWSMRRITWRRIRHAIGNGGDPLFEEQLLSLDDAGIKSESSGTAGNYAWSCFSEVREDSLRLFLFLGSTRAIVIPKKSLPEGLDRTYFSRHIENGHKASPAR